MEVDQSANSPGRGKRKDGKRGADEDRWGMRTAAMEKRILALRSKGMGVLKIGRTLGIGTSLAGALMERRREVALLAGPKE
jgi:hypothetical protein